ncbi:hypothetical protein SNEBB_011096 [Seison nebaliae]|nr:hypothetical protein SNEBB_011096 [Seison nebaliae]
MESNYLKRMEDEMAKRKELLKKIQNFSEKQQQLEGQAIENDAVLEELKLCDDKDIVYKMTGPVMFKHELKEAVDIIETRLRYINGEIKRVESLLEDELSKKKEIDENITTIQKEFSEMQMKTQKAK